MISREMAVNYFFWRPQKWNKKQENEGSRRLGVYLQFSQGIYDSYENVFFDQKTFLAELGSFVESSQMLVNFT